MPIDFKILSMMELRSKPGEVLDRVSTKGESFIVERNGFQLACLVPLSTLMPDVQSSRISRELDDLHEAGEVYTTSITGSREVEFQFAGEGPNGEISITITLPNGYPNVSPIVRAAPLPEKCPHRWKDGALCIFGAMEIWNPGEHKVIDVLKLARKWLGRFDQWQRTGIWEGQTA